MNQQPLTDREMCSATNTLFDTSFVESFPIRCTINPQDPPLPGQIYCIHSFIPMPGATPAPNGLFGVMKCRGTFDTRQSVDERAKELIRFVDSYHNIYTSYVGKPFPLGHGLKRFTREGEEVTLKNMMENTIRDKVRKDTLEEQAEIQSLKDREKKLKEDVNIDMEPNEKYAEMSVKLSHLTFTYTENKKKLEEIQQSILRVREDLDRMDEENDEYREGYVERIRQARKDAGITNDNNDVIMKFLDRDLGKVELGF